MDFLSSLMLYGLLLGPERLVYGFVYHYTPSFRKVAGLGESGKADLTIMHTLVSTFKVVQVACVLSDLLPKLGYTVPLDRMFGNADGLSRVAVGAALVGLGQVLNASIYYAIGSVGVHYGHQLGHEVPWCTTWPFTVLNNPQYIGVVLTFWGIYVMLAPSWTDYEWYAIPLVISFWYTLSCNLLESGTPRHTLGAKKA